MTSVIVSTVDNYELAVPQNPNYCSLQYTLQWRRGQLLVKCSDKVKQPYLPSLNDEKLLVNCLKHSSVNLVSIDGKLGETLLRFWAEACEKADKRIFLSRPTHCKLPKSGNWLWKLINWLLAFVLLLLTSPMMLGLVMLMRINSPETIFTYEWCVGDKGKLFRAIKFSTTSQYESKILGFLLKKSGLYHLPKLWNVVRGEMSLTESNCWTLEDAVQISLVGQQQVNTLPIITDSWEVPTKSEMVS
jgi:lipopolysaccharide/colanic/teichoic acid biosynthesis glycosyltransferase